MHPLRAYIHRFVPLTDTEWKPLAAALAVRQLRRKQDFTTQGVAASELVLAGAVLLFHTAFDRLLGYGLKHGTSFHDTHLGRTGPPARPAKKRPPARAQTSSTVAAR